MQCTSYFDDSDIDISPQDWVHSSGGTLDNDPRDSRDTVSPASGQDPNLMSSACISELLTDGTEKVDRGVQTNADIGRFIFVKTYPLLQECDPHNSNICTF